MKIALLQYCAGADKAANVKLAAGMVREALARGCKFVLMPETFNFRGQGEDYSLVAEDIPGPSVRPFMTMARQFRASILIGSLFERGTGHKVYNTSVLIDPAGRISAKYRKINLFYACLGDKILRESERFLSGRQKVAAPVGEFKVGLSICYDLRFGLLYGHYAALGVNVLTVPSCFTKITGQAHWEILVRARAIEALAYVLAPNQTGKDTRGVEAYGHSLIVSPWGEILAMGSAKGTEIIEAIMDMNEVRKARSKLPGVIGK